MSSSDAPPPNAYTFTDRAVGSGAGPCTGGEPRRRPTSSEKLNDTPGPIYNAGESIGAQGASDKLTRAIVQHRRCGQDYAHKRVDPDYYDVPGAFGEQKEGRR